MTYTSFDSYMKQRFGGKVYRLALSTGCTCPNRDGKCGVGGCIFCSAGGSGEFASSCHDLNRDAAAASIGLQIEEAKKRVAAKLSHNFAGYMAYFQSFTNTYFHDDEEFKNVTAAFFAAAGHPEILAVSVATRPDCLPHNVISMLSALNRIKPVIVELGLQTMHDSTAQFINRGYKTCVYDEAVSKLHEAGLGVVTHMIIGLPEETEEMMTDTLRHIIRISSGPDSDAPFMQAGPSAESADERRLSMPDGIKIQLLHVLKGTKLAELYESGKLSAVNYSALEYAYFLKTLLSLIPKDMVVHRITGDPPKGLLISPLWTADKKRTLNTINRILSDRSDLNI